MPPNAAAPLVDPIVTLLLGALVLEERITPVAIVAAALGLAGIALDLFPSRRARTVRRALPRNAHAVKAALRLRLRWMRSTSVRAARAR
jgi:hypothetical protein